MPRTDPLDLTGRVGLVTGGTRGIGFATARELASHGATVVVTGRADAHAAAAAAESLTSEFGTPSLGLACDSADPAAIGGAYRAIRTEYGRLDFLVNNAGVLEEALLGMITDEKLTRMLAVNLAGPILHVQAAARSMRGSGGAIVNMTSIIGVNGAQGYAAYAAAKAGIIGLTLSAAKELAPRGIRVNAIAPGVIATDMTAALAPEKLSQTVESVRMGRIGTASEVAGVAAFLVSDLSSYVTGQIIGVDGGMLI